MFASRDRIHGAAGVVDVAFTDRYGGISSPPYDSLDLSLSASDRADEVAANLARLADAFAVGRLAVMRQVHGIDVVTLDRLPGEPPRCDALVTSTPGLPLCVRVGDCVPVVLADANSGVVAVAHAGRSGVAGGVVTRAVRRMHELGGEQVIGWVGPHVCGACYEVPAELRAQVSAAVPATFAVTTRGTPALDLGAGVIAQLTDLDVEVRNLSRCTLESPDLYSHRRDGSAAGRFGGLVVLRAGGADG